MEFLDESRKKERVRDSVRKKAAVYYIYTVAVFHRHWSSLRT